MTLSASKFVAVFSLIVFCTAGGAGISRISPAPGDRATIKPGDFVPAIRGNYLWKVEGHIQNMTMTIPGFPPPAQGPILQLVLVEMTRGEATERASTEVGGVIPVSTDELKLKYTSDSEGKPILELYRRFTDFVSDRYVAGQTTRSVKNLTELPTLPNGYRWEEQSRVTGAGTLIPDLFGEFRSSEDTVTYVLSKARPEVADTFIQPRIVDAFSRNQDEFKVILECERSLKGKGQGA
jgi:hypothetical protein